MLPLTNKSDVLINTDALFRKEWNMNEMRGQDEMLWVKHFKTFSMIVSCKFSVNQQR